MDVCKEYMALYKKSDDDDWKIKWLIKTLSYEQPTPDQIIAMTPEQRLVFRIEMDKYYAALKICQIN